MRHVRLAQPILVLMNGKRNQGLILKPGNDRTDARTDA